ncbi:hypothetical protein GCM10027180_00210 [Microbulbifer echini]
MAPTATSWKIYEGEDTDGLVVKIKKKEGKQKVAPRVIQKGAKTSCCIVMAIYGYPPLRLAKQRVNTSPWSIV